MCDWLWGRANFCRPEQQETRPRVSTLSIPSTSGLVAGFTLQLQAEHTAGPSTVIEFAIHSDEVRSTKWAIHCTEKTGLTNRSVLEITQTLNF